MSGTPTPPRAARFSRKRFPLPALLACAGLLSALLFTVGHSRSRQATGSGRAAFLLQRLSRQSVWLQGAARGQPRKDWQPVVAALEADWATLTAIAPATAKTLSGHWRALDKPLKNRRISGAAADRFARAAAAQGETAARQAQRRGTLADRLMLGGAGGLSLCLLAGLALGRRQRVTQFQTTQAYLAAERASWEKQRGAADAQRERLIAELQQAQQHKTELDTLRRHGSHQFEEFFRTLPVACFCVAASGKIVRWNSACETLYGYAPGDILGQSLWETIVPEDERERFEAQLSRVLAGESLSEADRRDRHADGSSRDVRCSLAPLRDASGQIIGCLSANLALAEIKPPEQQAEVRQAPPEPEHCPPDVRAGVRALPVLPPAEAGNLLAEQGKPSDPITGLHTHGDFQEHVRLEFDRTARVHTPTSLVLIDLDHFGRYNETFGYRAGDQALRYVAQMLSAKVRSVDVVARYGADELAVLLPDTGRVGALVAARRFRAGIAEIAWDGEPLTASLSVIVLTPDLRHPREFVARAVAALRDSSGSGPNRLVCADP